MRSSPYGGWNPPTPPPPPNGPKISDLELATATEPEHRLVPSAGDVLIQHAVRSTLFEPVSLV